jgi:hypothetical protein
VKDVSTVVDDRQFALVVFQAYFALELESSVFVLKGDLQIGGILHCVVLVVEIKEDCLEWFRV